MKLKEEGADQQSPRHRSLEVNTRRHFYIYLFAALHFLNVHSALSQDGTSHTSEPSPSYLVFVELGGHGLVSINYEGYFSKRVGARVGYGVLIPVFLNFYFGDERMLEIGAGGVFSPYGPLGSFIQKKGTLLFGVTIGHKYQPNKGGLSLRYSFTPMFNPSNGRFAPLFGLSAGLAFK